MDGFISFFNSYSSIAIIVVFLVSLLVSAVVARVVILISRPFSRTMDAIALFPAASAVFLLAADFISLRQLNDNFNILESRTEAALSHKEVSMEVTRRFSQYSDALSNTLIECRMMHLIGSGGLIIPDRNIFPRLTYIFSGNNELEGVKSIPYDLKIDADNCSQYERIKNLSETFVLVPELSTVLLGFSISGSNERFSDLAILDVMEHLFEPEEIQSQRVWLVGPDSFLSGKLVATSNPLLAQYLSNQDEISSFDPWSQAARSPDYASLELRELLQVYSESEASQASVVHLEDIDPPYYVWVYLFVFSFALEVVKVVAPNFSRIRNI